MVVQQLKSVSFAMFVVLPQDKGSMAPLWFARTGWVGLVGLVLGFLTAQGREASMSKTILSMLLDCSKLGPLNGSLPACLSLGFPFSPPSAVSCAHGITIQRKAPF